MIKKRTDKIRRQLLIRICNRIYKLETSEQSYKCRTRRYLWHRRLIVRYATVKNNLGYQCKVIYRIYRCKIRGHGSVSRIAIN